VGSLPILRTDYRDFFEPTRKRRSRPSYRVVKTADTLVRILLKRYLTMHPSGSAGHWWCAIAAM
jgi:hypothetical protein